MRLEWLEDILAVIETGSFIRAAEKRFLTQPAFSRRIRSIENNLGVELFDRTKKPVQLKSSIIDQQRHIQELVIGLRDLRDELKRQGRETNSRVVIASQHAITTSLAPPLINKLSSYPNISIRLRSGNRDECYSLLMTKQADVILIYKTENEQLPLQEEFMEQCDYGRERFVPVCATRELHNLNEDYGDSEIPIIVYPSDVFLGQVLNQEILPQLNDNVSIRKKAETALTPATLQLVLAGVGVAWLPYSMVEQELKNGRLTELSDRFPSCELTVVAVHMNDPKSPVREYVWNTISSNNHSY